MERNFLLNISYDGSKFHGWQIQNNAYTVQECFQSALKSVLGELPDIKACSRTDTGVHARDFCISFKTESKINDFGLLNALNHFLPNSIVVKKAREVDLDFHARYSCKGKEYVYEIFNSRIRDPFLDTRALHYYHEIDEKRLNEAAKAYIGSHDFTSFCTKDSRKLGDMTRTVFDSRVIREGEMVKFIVSADGFLYNMVRIMVGTLIRVQEGRINPEDINGIIEARDRMRAGTTALAHGLYLNKVFYEEVN